jgi:hypothetical protein
VPQQVQARMRALMLVMKVAAVVAVLSPVLATSDRLSFLAKQQIASQCTIHAPMSVVRYLHTSKSPATLKHSSAAISTPSCMDQIEVPRCRAHNCNASAANPVPTRVATAKSSMLAAFSLRRSGSPRESQSRRRGRRWRTSGQMA